MTSLSQARTRYLGLQKACREAVAHGNLRRAGDLARRAHIVASHSGDLGLCHQAVANRSMVYLEMGRLEEAEQGLREIVLQSSDNDVICRAAFYLASSLRRQRRTSRALFFARRAADTAKEMQDPVWQARCHNLLGNIYLNQGHLEHAIKDYGQALAIWSSLPGDHRFALAIVLDNIGYGLTLLGRVHEGIPQLQAALTLALEIGDCRTEAECRQDLAHAFLGQKRIDEAREAALQALGLAERENYADIIRNCCYLLGELAAMEGKTEERDAYFQRLQKYFPDFPYLQHFLQVFDISSLLSFH